VEVLQELTDGDAVEDAVSADVCHLFVLMRS